MSYSISGLPDYWFGLPTVSNPPPPLEPVPSYINWANWSLGGIPHPTYGNFCGQPVGWVERSDTHHVVASPCWRAQLSSQLSLPGGFFFELPWDVQQGDGFRKGSTHPTGYFCGPESEISRSARKTLP